MYKGKVYLKTSSATILHYNADIWRIRTGSNEQVYIIMADVSHLEMKMQ